MKFEVDQWRFAALPAANGRDGAPRNRSRVNSLGTDARIWDELINQVCAPHYSILSYDKRGHGLSDPPRLGDS